MMLRMVLERTADGLRHRASPDEASPQPRACGAHQAIGLQAGKTSPGTLHLGDHFQGTLPALIGVLSKSQEALSEGRIPNSHVKAHSKRPHPCRTHTTLRIRVDIVVDFELLQGNEHSRQFLSQLRHDLICTPRAAK